MAEVNNSVEENVHFTIFRIKHNIVDVNLIPRYFSADYKYSEYTRLRCTAILISYTLMLLKRSRISEQRNNRSHGNQTEHRYPNFSVRVATDRNIFE